MAQFRDIPQFTQFSGYTVDVGWDYLPIQVARHVEDYKLNINPDFQRGYVWTLDQKVRYVEYAMRGGHSGRDLWFNNPEWVSGEVVPGTYVLVDGKQRLDAVLGFLSNEFPVFGGNFRRDYTDRMRITHMSFKWHINTLQTRDECLQWYIDLNRGGTVHTEQEIQKVRDLMGSGKWDVPTDDEIRKYAGFDRSAIATALERERAAAAERAASNAALRAAEAAKPKRTKRDTRAKR